MPVDSHVQMPASIMRGFFIREKNKCTYVFEFGKEDIFDAKIKKYGNVFAYFEDKTEAALSKTECDFGTVKKRIIDNLTNKEAFTLSAEERRIVNIFLTSLLSRKRTIPYNVECRSIMCKWFGIHVTPSRVVDTTISKYPNGELFSEYSISYMINKTDTNFVCPENCLFSIMHFDELNGSILFPLSPKIAIIISESNFDIMEICSEDIIKDINGDALYSSLRTYSNFLISSTKGELQELQKILNDEHFRHKIYLTRLYDKVLGLNDEDLEELPIEEKQILATSLNHGMIPDIVANKIKNYI